MVLPFILNKRDKYMPDHIVPSLSLLAAPALSTSKLSGAVTTEPRPSRLPLAAERSGPPATPLPEKSVNAAPAVRQAARCSVRACVFPVSEEGLTRCRYHELQHSEGELFQSHQPSHLLALHAPLGISDSEPDDSRYKDRTRQAAEREAFLSDGIA